LRYTPVAGTNAMYISSCKHSKKEPAACYKRKPATKVKVTPMTEEWQTTSVLNAIIALLYECFN